MLVAGVQREAVCTEVGGRDRRCEADVDVGDAGPAAECQPTSQLFRCGRLEFAERFLGQRWAVIRQVSFGGEHRDGAGVAKCAQLLGRPESGQ